MVKAGLNIENRSEGLERLFSINREALTSGEALASFVSLHGCDKAILQKGLEALKRPIPDSLPLEAVPGAIELIEELGQENTLSLVTIGSAELQLQKMKKAGIQQGKFSTIVVERGSSKKSIYQRILKENGCDPSEVIVCGDRVPIDLSPGKEIGFTTVHFPNGRGRYFSTPKEDVDHTIPALKELKKVIEKSRI